MSTLAKKYICYEWMPLFRSWLLQMPAPSLDLLSNEARLIHCRVDASKKIFVVTVILALEFELFIGVQRAIYGPTTQPSGGGFVVYNSWPKESPAAVFELTRVIKRIILKDAIHIERKW
jgi:hypothetical protein